MYGGENAGLKGGSAIITAWLTVPIRRAERRLRLFCFPHAGGGASSFVPLAGLLPSSIELAAVLLPGRETRFREPPFARMEPLVQALADGLRDELGAPFAFMGHSMGALVAFELARELRRRGVPPWDASGIMGHASETYDTTEIYAEYDPNYLSRAVAAIDGFMSDVGRVAARPTIRLPQQERSSSVLAPFPETTTTPGKTGAGDGNRTHDIQLGKLSFYH